MVVGNVVQAVLPVARPFLMAVQKFLSAQRDIFLAGQRFHRYAVEPGKTQQVLNARLCFVRLVVRVCAALHTEHLCDGALCVALCRAVKPQFFSQCHFFTPFAVLYQ